MKVEKNIVGNMRGVKYGRCLVFCKKCHGDEFGVSSWGYFSIEKTVKSKKGSLLCPIHRCPVRTRPHRDYNNDGYKFDAKIRERVYIEKKH